MDGPSHSDSNRVDWAIIFDLVASEYGYTWAQFTELTYKQLNVFLEAILRRTHNKTVVLAAMHGIKLDPYRRIKPPSERMLKKALDETEKILKEKQIALKKIKKR